MIVETYYLIKKMELDTNTYYPDTSKIKKTDKKNNPVFIGCQAYFTAYLDNLDRIYSNLSGTSYLKPHHHDSSLFAEIRSDIFNVNNEDSEANVSKKLKNIAEFIKKILDIDGIKEEVFARLRCSLSNEEKEENDSVNKLLEQYNHEELKHLTAMLRGDIPRIELSVSAVIKDVPLRNKILGYVRQNALDRALTGFGFSNDGNNSKRIIITTKDVIYGLEYIKNYLGENGALLETVTAEDISKGFAPAANHHSSGPVASIEIAWGLLSGLKKHAGDNPFVTVSFDIAKAMIPRLTKNSTLVLDGHGGKQQITVSDRILRRRDKKTTAIIMSLIKKDQEKNIDHFILQSCNSGNLDREAREAMIITRKNLGKSRGTLVIDKYSGKLFEEDTINAVMYYAIKETRKIAFTFHENLISPSNRISDGNLGIARSEKTSDERAKWPKNVTSHTTETQDTQESPLLKSITFVPDEGHRKWHGQR